MTRKKIPALLLVLLTPFAVVDRAAAEPLLDQEQPVIDAPGFVYAIGGGSEQKLAQVVTPAISGGLVAVGLPLACDGDLTVEIQGVQDGVPDGTLLGAETFPNTAVGLPFPTTFRILAFAKPILVSAGTPYAIVLTVLSTTTGCGIAPGPVGDPYPGGNAFFDSRPNAPGWVPLSIGAGREDLPFQTFVDPTLQPDDPGSGAASVHALATAVAEMGLEKGVERSLLAKLSSPAVAADSDRRAACELVKAFANHVRAQAGKHVPAAQAADLLTKALAAEAALACGGGA